MMLYDTLETKHHIFGYLKNNRGNASANIHKYNAFHDKSILFTLLFCLFHSQEEDKVALSLECSYNLSSKLSSMRGLILIIILRHRHKLALSQECWGI